MPLHPQVTHGSPLHPPHWSLPRQKPGPPQIHGLMPSQNCSGGQSLFAEQSVAPGGAPADGRSTHVSVAGSKHVEVVRQQSSFDAQVWPPHEPGYPSGGPVTAEFDPTLVCGPSPDVDPPDPDAWSLPM